MSQITLKDVGKRVMGDSSNPPYNLESLCTSDNISMWAKWKPVNLDKIGAITDEERRQIGYGLKSADKFVSIGCNGHLGTSESGILDWVKDSFRVYENNNGKDVVWDKPKTCFRLTDFANQDMSDQYYGSEQATYHVSSHDSYSSTLRYNSAQSSGSITLNDLKEFLGMDYTDINYMEIVCVYRINSSSYKIVSTGKTVLELQQDGGNASPGIEHQGNTLYEGFFAAITPLDETGLSGWNMALSNDQEGCRAEIIRFPDSYFKGRTPDFSQPEEDAPRLWFDTDYYSNYYSDTDSNACIYYDRGGILNIRTMLDLHADESEFSNIEVTVFTKYNREPNFGSSTDLTSSGGEYCYAIEVQVVQDFGENIGDVEMKIRYKVDNSTYWVDLINGTVLKTEPNFVKISNIRGIREA